MRVALGLFMLALAAAPSAVAPTGSMSTPRAAHSATLLPSGEVLIAGGCTVDSCELDRHGAETELFDPGTGRFRRGPNLLREAHGRRPLGGPGDGLPALRRLPYHTPVVAAGAPARRRASHR